MSRVAGVTALASLSGSRLQRLVRSRRTGTARAPEISSAPTKLGQAGVGTIASSPGPAIIRVASLDRVHAADGDEEILRRERSASRRRAVDAGHVGGDRRAQLRHAALVGVEGLAAVERGLGRLADERRRRQVALADPQWNQPLPAAAVVEHLDDAARGDGAHRRADLIEPIRIERGGGDIHFRVMDDRGEPGKGRPGQGSSLRRAAVKSLRAYSNSTILSRRPGDLAARVGGTGRRGTKGSTNWPASVWGIGSSMPYRSGQTFGR